MKREWLLAAAVTLATLALALALLRHYVPALLGAPIDLQLVQLDERQPAFFAGVFRPEDIRSKELTLKDPITGVRGKPLYPKLVSTGPNDVLGFRNPDVPVVADVVAIGDSQTYGLNASMPHNWPHQLERGLGDARLAARVYSMAVGGWSAPQYLLAGQYASALRPRVMVLALYAGNDPLESFMHVYGSEHWAQLRPDSTLDAADAPPVQLPVPVDQQWRVPLDALTTIMLVDYRRANVLSSPAVDAGWQIMQNVTRQLAEGAAVNETALVVTLIPTKESAYAPLLSDRGVASPGNYSALVREEERRRQDFAAFVAALPGVHYVDVSVPMQEALRSGEAIYLQDFDGHPNAAGYARIAAALQATVASLLPTLPCGPIRFQSRDTLWHSAIASGRGHYWLLNSSTAATAAAVVTVDERLVEGMRELGGRAPDLDQLHCE